MLRVVGVEAVPGAAAQTGPALAAHSPPVEDHEVARHHVRHALADRFHDARGLVAEQEGEVVVDAAVAIVQIRVADAAGLDLHQRLARAGVGHVDRFQSDRSTLLPRDNSTDLVSHGHSSTDLNPER